MKKLLAIALLLFAGLTVSAQGTWSTGMNEADEQKGLLGGPYYRYDVEGMGTFILWDWEDWKFRIITDKGKFYVQTGSVGKYVSYSMGLYTLDGQLTEKVESLIEADISNYNTATINTDWWYLHSPKKKIKRMVQALKSGEGYVRIVCKRRDMQDFDLKITKYDISEEYSTAYKDYPQVLNSATMFCDVDDYSTLDEIAVAQKNKTLKSTTLKKGERFKVISLDVKSMNAKIQLPSGKVGWIAAIKVPNPRDFLPYVSFRDKYLPNIQTGSVAPGMTREEVYIVNGNYVYPGAKSYKAYGDYIWYNFTNGMYIFYKNSLFYATNCKGAFYYRAYIHYKLTNASRGESVMNDNISGSSSYKDDLLSVIWNVDRNKIDFNIKNYASGSIKVLWDEMAFVGFNGESHRVIHKGIKYSEKEKEQAPSIIARNAELHELIIPADKIYYQKTQERWAAHPFLEDGVFSPDDETTKRPSGRKIQVLLPVIVNEKRYEYQFVFEIEKIDFSLFNFDHYKNGRIADEL